MNATRQYIIDNTLRLEASHRGGGIEIDLSDAVASEGMRMTAYQNYLGGGMLGSIQNSYNFNIETLPKDIRAIIEHMTDELNRYYHEVTNDMVDEYDEWASGSYDEVQARASSGY